MKSNPEAVLRNLLMHLPGVKVLREPYEQGGAYGAFFEWEGQDYDVCVAVSELSREELEGACPDLDLGGAAEARSKEVGQVP
jgi:hypothetical protein